VCQGCDRSSQDKHALRHYETHRDGLSHDIALNLNDLAVWYATLLRSFVDIYPSRCYLHCTETV